MSRTSALSLAGVLASGRILIVEDDVDFSASLVELLDPEKFQVRTCESGMQALSILDTFDPDLSLIDIRLGRENGLDVMTQLREKKPQLLCILMTAYAAIDSAVLAIRRGADDYLTKPIEPEGLKDLLERSLLRVRHSHADDRRERMASLGQLAAGLAHDMNNMLAAIVTETENAVSLVGLAHQEPELRERLKTIQLAGTRAGELTRQLLVFTRGQIPTSPCDNPNEVLRHAAALVRSGLPEGVTLDLELCSTSHAVALDASQLEQVALNLLVNAREAIKAPGTIQLKSGRDLHPRQALPGYGLVVTVVDTGIGIPQQNRRRIFEPFFSARVDGSGTGLGLSTVYGLLQSVRGEIGVQSQPGVGTRFDVWIPETPFLPQESPRQGAPVPTTAGASCTVLLCDDDLGLLAALTRLLKRAGHVVIPATNIRTALDQWNQHREQIDLVMVDIRLGAERGTSIAADIHGDRPDLPILLMSGDLSESEPSATDGPALFRLQKPFAFEDLVAILPMLRGRNSLSGAHI